MFLALWAHRCRSFPAALSQWSEMVVKRTGPQAFVWTEKWGLHFPHKQNYSCSSPCQHKDCSKTCLSLWYFFTTDHQLISLQGRNSNKVLTFKRKLALWAKRSQEKRRDMFALLNDKSANVPPPGLLAPTGLLSQKSAHVLHWVLRNSFVHSWLRTYLA